MKEKRRRSSLFPQTLSKSLEPLVKPIYKKHGFAEHRLLTEWAAIVGPELAACSVPQKLTFAGHAKESGTLHILVASGRALELQHMQPVIIDKIATYFGYPAVVRLVFMQTSVSLFRREEKTPSGEKLSVRADLEKIAVQCDDEALRDALVSLGKTIAPAGHS